MHFDEDKNKKQGRLVIISAPSGAGKSTVIRRLLKQNSDMAFSISDTTRNIRRGEREGRDYFFVSKKKFNDMKEAGLFLEWAEVYDNFYGTGLERTRELLEEGKDVLLDIDIQGAKQVSQSSIKPIMIFILPPGKGELVKRLRKRGDLSEDELKKRINRAYGEIKQADSYEYVVVNRSLEKTVEYIEKIILSQRLKVEYNKGLIDEILNSFNGGD